MARETCARELGRKLDDPKLVLVKDGVALNELWKFHFSDRVLTICIPLSITNYVKTTSTTARQVEPVSAVQRKSFRDNISNAHVWNRIARAV